METTTVPLPASAIAHSLAEAIASKRQQRLEVRAHEPPWKPRRHYASNLSGCVRQMVYAHTHWQEKEPFTPEGIAHMEDGNHEERVLIQELLVDGFDVVEQQVQLDDDRYWVTGKIDGKLRWQGRRVPFEVKRIQPYVFKKIKSVEDMQADEFLLKKLRQLTLYLILHNEEVGLFIFSDGLGGRKVVVVPLDYELGESILRDLEAANVALKAIAPGPVDANDPRLPARIPYNSKVCGYCPWRRVCLPDLNFGEGMVLGPEELTEAVARYEQLKVSASEYERLKKSIKTSVKDKPLVKCGAYLVIGKWTERKMPAKSESVIRFWDWKVETLNPSETDGHA